MSFLETLASVEAYMSKVPPDKQDEVYWWIDGFAIDQHECQYAPPSIDDNSAAWAEIFQQAIKEMGNVVRWPRASSTSRRRSCSSSAVRSSAVGIHLLMCIVSVRR